VLNSGHGFRSHLSKNVFLLLRFHSSELLGTPRHLIQSDPVVFADVLTLHYRRCRGSKYKSSFSLTRRNINAIATSICREEYYYFLPKAQSQCMS